MEQHPSLTPQAANVHKGLFDVIEFSKKQQWTITNYVVAIYVGIAGIKQAIMGVTVIEKAFLTALALLAFCCATCFLIVIQRDMGKARVRLERIHHDWLREAERKSLGIKPYVNPTLRGVWFLVGLTGVAAIGAGLVIYFLWR